MKPIVNNGKDDVKILTMMGLGLSLSIITGACQDLIWSYYHFIIICGQIRIIYEIRTLDTKEERGDRI